MEKKYRLCQSCGMPMKNDIDEGGTELDGSKSLKYCSYCYQKGAFTTDSTVEEMREFCMDMMIDRFRYPRFIARILTMNIPRLERWKMCK